MKALASLIALALVSSAQVFGQPQQDAAAVCGAAEKHYAAIRAGDTDTVLQQHLPDFTFFTSDGGLLWSFPSLDRQQTELIETDPSFASQTHIRHCSAQVYGTTGIATYYIVGTVTSQGSTTSGTWRVTEVWVKQGNDWKEAHHHESPLLGSVMPVAAGQDPVATR
jgi:ketosteroid isomerase-like protein